MMWRTTETFKYRLYVVYYKMEEKAIILKENFNEYFDQGNQSLKKQKYNAATTLFFKAIVAGCDLFILIKEGIAPSSHTKRFRILEEKYPLIYKLVDRDFPFYQDSYTKKMNLEAAQLLKDDAEHIKKTTGI